MKRLQLLAGDTFRSLRVRNYRLFFVGQLVSQAGTWMQMIAVIFVVLEITDDGFALGLATAAQFLPVLLIGAWAGVVTDRVDHYRFMMMTQAAFTLVAAAFTVLVFTDMLDLVAVYLLSTLFGVVTALDNPVRRALVVDLVDVGDVPNAVALNSSLMTGSRVVGPAVAGMLISGVGVEWCFAVNLVTYLAVLIALARMDRDDIRASPRVARGAGQLREGLRYVWGEPRLRLPILLMAVVGTLAFEFQVTLPLLAERALGGDDTAFTVLYSLMSLGSVVGALGIARRRDVSTHLLAWTSVWLGTAMAVLAMSPNLVAASVAAVPVGVATVILISGSNSVIQLRASPEMRGRALALTAVVFIGSTPIGGPIAGWFSEHLGPTAGIWLGAVASTAAGTWVLWELRRLDIQAPKVGIPAADSMPRAEPGPVTLR